MVVRTDTWSSLTEFQTTQLHIYGCGGPDNFIGSPNGDWLIGGSDNDALWGLGGGDLICGDTGSLDPSCDPGLRCFDTGADAQDALFGGAGNDGIYGNGGDDWIYGEAGDDSIMGNEGPDNIDGGEGNDWIMGDAGDDTLWGGRGCDIVNGHAGDDTIYLYMTDANTPDLCTSSSCPTPPCYNSANGGSGNDHIYGAKDATNRMWGDAGDDTIVGNNLTDWICGGNGIYDNLHGGDGDDIVVDCLASVQETLEDGPSACDHTIYGDAGNSDIMCYYEIGAIASGAKFCLDGGGGSPDYWYCDEPHATGCTPESCVYETTEAACSANGTFTCSCS